MTPRNDKGNLGSPTVVSHESLHVGSLLVSSWRPQGCSGAVSVTVRFGPGRIFGQGDRVVDVSKTCFFLIPF